MIEDKKVIKICGIKSNEVATYALDNGATLVGVILVPNKKRTIDYSEAEKISKSVKTKNKKPIKEVLQELQGKSFDRPVQYFTEVSKLLKENGPYLVGVFRNQPVEEVFELAEKLSIDIIQLHGSEDKEQYLKYNKDLKFGIIGRYVLPNDVGLMKQQFDKFVNRNGFLLPLLDSEEGGEGKTIDWSLVKELKFGKFILAGGLSPSNLVMTKTLKNLIGYDVSSGVEDTLGNKDLQKVKEFITIGEVI